MEKLAKRSVCTTLMYITVEDGKHHDKLGLSCAKLRSNIGGGEVAGLFGYNYNTFSCNLEQIAQNFVGASLCKMGAKV